MRSHLLDPTEGDARLTDAISLGREIYMLHERGADYSATVKRLSLLVEHPIADFDVEAAFGSIGPDAFARRQLIAWDQLPLDLTQQEMLEMIERVCDASGDELQIEFWLGCLRANTGDERISDMIFWPGSYFGDGNDARKMSPSEILSTASEAGEKSIAVRSE